MSSVPAAGDYVGKAKDWKFVAGKENKDPYFLILYEVYPPGGDPNADPYEIQSRMHWNGGAYAITLKTLREIGWTGKDLNELRNRGGELDKHLLDLNIVEDTYEGVTRLIVRFVNRRGGRFADAPVAEGPSFDAFLRDLNARIPAGDKAIAEQRATRMAQKATGGAARPTGGAANGSGGASDQSFGRVSSPNDSEIPF